MHVIHVHWDLGFGGIQTMLVNIANNQVNLGARVTVIIINDSREQSLLDVLDKRVEYVCLGRKLGSYSPMYICRLNRELARRAPDVVHLHSTELYDILLSKKIRRITCATVHDTPKGVIRRWGLATRLVNIFDHLRRVKGNVLCCDRVPRVFAISNVVKQGLKKYYGVDSIAVCNGINARFFIPRQASLPPRQPFRVVMVACLNHDKKGQDLLISAAAVLRGQIDITFIGKGKSLNFLKQLTAELKLGESIRFLGAQTQKYIAEHLSDYDMFCLPSRIEGFGLVVAEAMAANLPVLVATGQGSAEVTRDDKYGWVFTNGDVEDLARWIMYIKEHYAEAMEKAERACRYVIETYDVSVTAKRYLEEYEKFLNSLSE